MTRYLFVMVTFFSFALAVFYILDWSKVDGNLTGRAKGVGQEADIESAPTPEARTCQEYTKEDFDSVKDCVRGVLSELVNLETGASEIKDAWIGSDGVTYEKNDVPDDKQPAYKNWAVQKIIDAYGNSETLNKVLEEQTCPITLCDFDVPTVASDGHTYELEYLRQLPLNPQRAVPSPINRENLKPEVYRNKTLIDLLRCSEKAKESSERTARVEDEEATSFRLEQYPVGRDLEARGIGQVRRLGEIEPQNDSSLSCFTGILICAGGISAMIAGDAWLNEGALLEGEGDSGTMYQYETNVDGQIMICGAVGMIAGALVGESLRAVARNIRERFDAQQ